MLDSIPVPLQAVMWPLIGTAILLLAGRYLPYWAQRLLAAAAALASWLALWHARSGGVDRIELFWEPLNLFRISPVASVTGPALLTGLALASVTAASVLAIQGSEPRRVAWRGLALMALAGSLVMAMASNLLTLVLGSGLIDVALIAIALSAPDSGDRTIWRIAVPGIISTLLLFLSALLMDVRVGHATLWASNAPAEVLALLGVAGALRLVVYPLYPRGLNRPEHAAILLLPVGAGIYLTAQVQAAASPAEGSAWMLALGCLALAAGAFLAWSRAIAPNAFDPKTASQPGPDWMGTAINQTGYALAFVVLAGSRAPWPLLSLTLALSSLAILWDAGLNSRPASSFTWPEWIARRLGGWQARAQAILEERAPAVQRFLGWWARWGATLVLLLALASLAGLPFTVGAVGRWSFYALLLRRGSATPLVVALIADAMLAASLWIALRGALGSGARLRLPPGTFLVLLALTIFLVIVGIAPNAYLGSIGLEPLGTPPVSVWGLGLVTVLPWLLGGWLARSSSRLKSYAIPAQQVVGLDWLFGAANWLGQRLSRVIGWLGVVGEGEGWWGWSLVILALGAILLSLR